MKKTKDFLFGCDRYVFDFGECSVKNGFAQIDTKQDFHGHGAWANPFTLRIVSYTEGDLYNTIAENEQEFVQEIRRIQRFYGTDFIGIDAMADQEIKVSLQALGLGDLLH